MKDATDFEQQRTILLNLIDAKIFDIAHSII